MTHTHLSADWRIHFPGKLAQSEDLQMRMISTFRQVLPPDSLEWLPSLIGVGCNPMHNHPAPALWLNYGHQAAILAHADNYNKLTLCLRTWWQLTGITEIVIVGSDGKWLATFDPAPQGKYVLHILGGAS